MTYRLVLFSFPKVEIELSGYYLRLSKKMAITWNGKVNSRLVNNFFAGGV